MMSDVDMFIKQKVSVVLGRFWKQTSENNRNMTEQQQQKKNLIFFLSFSGEINVVFSVVVPGIFLRTQQTKTDFSQRHRLGG